MPYDPHTDPHAVRVDIFHSEANAEDDEERWPGPDKPATEFVAWLQGKIEQAPEEHRAAVKFDIGQDYGYESSSWVTVEVYYYRPETLQEKSERVERGRAEAARVKAKERAKLAALKLKYPNG